MPFPFGRAFTYTFFALVDDEFEDLSGVSTPAAIYVSKDQPSRAQAAAGTGSNVLETISTWSNTADGKGKSFTIAAIDDPDPTDADTRHTYWIAINFKYTASEQLQTIVRALPMQRLDAWHTVISTAPSDLEAIFPDVDSYASATRQLGAIGLAKDRIKQTLEAQGFQWAMIWRPDRLNVACQYWAISSIMFGLASGDPKWIDLAREHRDTASGILDGVKLEYTGTTKEQPTTLEQPGNFVRVTR